MALQNFMNSIGCAHYDRKSQFVTPCCNKVYTCRFCHDAQENHPVNRHGIRELVCALRKKRQPVGVNCQSCGVKFGKYTCLKCNLFDDENKGQFHCDDCGICRIGGADKNFHCATCNICLDTEFRNSHKCLENASRKDCPVCKVDLHTSRDPCHIPKCGHFLHNTCFHKHLEAGNNTCPICKNSLQ